MAAVSRVDWEPSDIDLCNKLGERLAKGGYVYFRSRTHEWIVCTPDQEQVHQTVRVGDNEYAPSEYFSRLDCTCTVSRFNNGVCVHKAAVHAHATSDGECAHYHKLVL